MKQFITLTLLVATGLIALYLMLEFMTPFLSFGVALLLIAIAVLVLYIVDYYLLTGFDTIEEVTKGNIAAGLLILAYSIVISAAIISAFVVWR